MQSRRNFIGKVATGLAGTLAASNVLGANDRVRVGLIGSGARGSELLREVLACPNTECAAVADIYTKHLDAVQGIIPGVKIYQDYQRLLENHAVDAVVISTPPHLHASQFVASVDAGKHVYVERVMAFTLEDAKAMRVASQRKPDLIMQVGHQACSSGHAVDAARFLEPELMGRVTGIRAQFFRNTPLGKPQWTRPIYPDMTPENIDWKAFLGEGPRREFDANRYHNWRLFQDYSGGSVTENLSMQLAFWYKLLDLEIPRAATMAGGVYLWKDGREVPDTMHVSLEHSEEVLFSWDSGFGNSQPGVSEEVLGTHGTISRSQQLRYAPQKVNRPAGNEMVGVARTEPRAHMHNFLEAIRERQQVNCPVDLGFRVSIACHMALESYRQQRTVFWDPAQEEIV